MSNSFRSVSVGQFLFHLCLPSKGNTPSPSGSHQTVRGRLTDGLLLANVSMEWNFPQEATQMTLAIHGSVRASHPAFLSSHPSLRFCPLLPYETTKQLEILILNPKSLSYPQLDVTWGHNYPYMVESSKQLQLLLWSASWLVESLEPQQEGGFLRQI